LARYKGRCFLIFAAERRRWKNASHAKGILKENRGDVGTVDLRCEPVVTIKRTAEDLGLFEGACRPDWAISRLRATDQDGFPRYLVYSQMRIQLK